MHPNIIDLAGQRFGTLLVASYTGASRCGAAKWLALCDCGNEVVARGDYLRDDRAHCQKCSSRRDRMCSLAEAINANSELVAECGCQIWLAGVNRNGYGTLRFEGKMQSAHRLSWIVTRGAIPAGLNVLHRCDVRPCINPEHLFLGTHADNVADMMRKGRHRFGPNRPNR